MNADQLDQEITLHLQKIDSDLSYCFTKITKEIIPCVNKYGHTCDNVMDSSAWLKEMFQQSANVQLVADSGPESKGPVLEPRASLFPEVANEGEDYYTGNQFAEGDPQREGFSEQENADDDGVTEDDTTLEKQRKKRKVSLQIQQRFNSSSTDMSINRRMIENSSPVKLMTNEPEAGTDFGSSIKDQLIKAGTVIHFNSKREG